MESNKKPSTPETGAALQPTAAGEPSFRILYYGATGAAVPFKWESQPGTPKHPLSSGATLPPLTPPPSYYSGAGADSPAKHQKKIKKRTSLRRLVSRSSSHVSSSPSSSPGGSYSSSSSFSGGGGDYFSPSPLLTPSRKPRWVFMCFGTKTPLVNGGCGLFSVMGCRRRPSSRSVDYVV